MTLMTNYEVVDGRDNSSHPALDDIRSCLGRGSGRVAAGANTAFLTIPAGKVFHVTSIDANCEMGNAAQSAIVTLYIVRSAVSSLEVFRLHFNQTGEVNAAKYNEVSLGDIEGLPIVASTVTRYYIGMSAVTASASIIVGGLLRNRTPQDTSS